MIKLIMGFPTFLPIRDSCSLIYDNKTKINMAKTVFRHGDPRKEKIEETIRYDIVPNSSEISKVKSSDILRRRYLRSKNFSELTESEKEEFNRYFTKNDNTEE
jgi:hypothetical protein